MDGHLMMIVVELGLRSWHYPCHKCFLSSGGWPDRVYLGPRGVLYRELKGKDDTLSPAQRQVGLAMLDAGLDWQVWTPQQLGDGAARAQLESTASK